MTATSSPAKDSRSRWTGRKGPSGPCGRGRASSGSGGALPLLAWLLLPEDSYLTCAVAGDESRGPPRALLLAPESFRPSADATFLRGLRRDFELLKGERRPGFRDVPSRATDCDATVLPEDILAAAVADGGDDTDTAAAKLVAATDLADEEPREAADETERARSGQFRQE